MIKKLTSEAVPAFQITIGAVMISFSGVWVKVAHVTPATSAFYRVLFGGIFLLAATIGKKELQWQGLRHLWLAMVCGLLFSLDLYLWHRSIHYIGPGLATILGNFEVFLLALVGFVFFREKIRIQFVLSLPVAILGLYLIVGIEWKTMTQLHKAGIYFGLATAVMYASTILVLRKLQSVQKKGSIFPSLMMVSLIAALFLGIGVSRAESGFDIPDLQSWGALLSVGLFSQAIGWMLITKALPLVKASFAGLILLLQPSLAFVWDVIFFHRPTQPANWLGVLLAITAIYLGASYGSKSE